MSMSRSRSICRKPAKAILLGGVSLSMLALSQTALAQSAEDEVVVTGSRQVIQDAISLKRQSTQVVDGLSADEIGDIPALSIGEALETVTGVASHRENGGATEVSIRGLGPYLSSTTINGRIVGNGSGDRSVNFSQFPSELMNKLAVFKTQDAGQIEGGVAGQIQIETLKPLDFGKRRIQGEIKGNINPDQLNQEDTMVGDIGYRGTLSYVDQFELPGGGDIGISIGGQLSKISQPEAEIRSTSNSGSSSFACIVRTNVVTPIGIGFSDNPIENDRDCEDYRAPNSAGGDNNNVGFVTQLTPTGDARLDAIDFSAPYVLVPSQRHYRQNDTEDKRDAIFGAIQWQPNDRLDINIDAQWSERTQAEERNDLTFNGWKRNEQGLGGLPDFEGMGLSDPASVDLLEYRANGGITRAFTDNTVEVQGGNYARVETFEGVGINGTYDVNERLSVSADVAYSNVERTEQAIEFRIQSDTTPTIEFDTSTGIPLYTLYDATFDVNDHDNFVDRLRVRIDNDLYRKNAFLSGRLDFDYDIKSDWVTNIEFGARFSGQEYVSTPGGSDSGNPLLGNTGRLSFEIENDGELTVNGREVLDDNNDGGLASAQQSALESSLVAIIGSTNQACRGAFPETDFLSNLRGDNALVTNVALDGSVISSTSTWGVFDAQCVAETSVSALNGILAAINAYSLNPDANENSFGAALNAFTTDIPGLVRENSRTTDVQEDTLAFYAMANYETTFNDLPLRGNFGARVVNTEVTSSSFRQAYEITNTGGDYTIAAVGDPIPVQSVSDYTTILPSASAILDIADDKLLRFGAFRALSRADPADMGFGRSFATTNTDENGDPITNPDDLIQTVNVTGNPAIGPLTSWNFDAGYEWYPDADSILAISAYYKKFQGGFANTTENEEYTVDGQTITRPVVVQQVSDDTSSLFGIEITGAHRFSYLPGLLSGLGVKASYNYVDSNFEFEDSLYGDRGFIDANGNFVQTHEGIVAPGGLPGLSENVFSGTVYYQIGGLDLSAIYKYRDNYFQPFTSDGTRLRYIGDVGVLEARASYKINDNFRVSVEAINLLDAEKEQFQWVEDNQYEVNSYGPRIFFGVRGRF